MTDYNPNDEFYYKNLHPMCRCVIKPMKRVSIILPNRLIIVQTKGYYLN